MRPWHVWVCFQRLWARILPWRVPGPVVSTLAFEGMYRESIGTVFGGRCRSTCVGGGSGSGQSTVCAHGTFGYVFNGCGPVSYPGGSQDRLYLLSPSKVCIGSRFGPFLMVCIGQRVSWEGLVVAIVPRASMARLGVFSTVVGPYLTLEGPRTGCIYSRLRRYV